MKLQVLVGLLMTTAAALIVVRSHRSGSRPIAVQEAAERLRQAWANNHTVA